MKQEQLLRTKVERTDAIELNGWLTRILLPELKAYGDRVYPSEARAGYLLEAERFHSWLYALADRPSGVRRPLAFEGELIRVGIIMVAQKTKLEQAGLDPYLEWFDTYFDDMQLDAVYVVGSDDTIDAVCAVRDAISSDHRVNEVATYQYQHGRSLRARIAVRERAICVAVTRDPAASARPRAVEPSTSDSEPSILTVRANAVSSPVPAIEGIPVDRLEFEELVEASIEDEIEGMRAAAAADAAFDDDAPVRTPANGGAGFADEEVMVPLHEVEAFVLTWVRDRQRQGRPSFVSALGAALQKRFPGAQPLHVRLGYERATDMLRDFDGVVLGAPGPAMTLSVVAGDSISGAPDLDEIAAYIEAWLAKTEERGREPLLSSLGFALRPRFPIGQTVHEALGYPNLRSLVEALDEFSVEGPRSRASIARVRSDARGA